MLSQQTKVLEAMLLCRPVIETGWQNILLLHMLLAVRFNLILLSETFILLNLLAMLAWHAFESSSSLC
jgi:hypothetical protein